MRYKIYVDDNFHYMDESERYLKGAYETAEAAIGAVKAIVDAELKSYYKPDMPAHELYALYKHFGEDPFIVSEGRDCTFSAWDYARERCQQICGQIVP
jgi:hypothetical protein